MHQYHIALFIVVLKYSYRAHLPWHTFVWNFLTYSCLFFHVTFCISLSNSKQIILLLIWKSNHTYILMAYLILLHSSLLHFTDVACFTTRSKTLHLHKDYNSLHCDAHSICSGLGPNPQNRWERSDVFTLRLTIYVI